MPKFVVIVAVVVSVAVACSKPEAKRQEPVGVATVSNGAPSVTPSTAPAPLTSHGVDPFGRPLRMRAIDGQMSAGTVAIGGTDFVFTVPASYVAIPIGSDKSAWVVEPAIAPAEHEKHTGFKRVAWIRRGGAVPSLAEEIESRCAKDKRTVEKTAFLGGYLLRCDGPSDYGSGTVHKHDLAFPLPAPDPSRPSSVRCEDESEDAATAKVTNEICRSIRKK